MPTVFIPSNYRNFQIKCGKCGNLLALLSITPNGEFSGKTRFKINLTKLGMKIMMKIILRPFADYEIKKTKIYDDQNRIELVQDPKTELFALRSITKNKENWFLLPSEWGIFILNSCPQFCTKCGELITEKNPWDPKLDLCTICERKLEITEKKTLRMVNNEKTAKS